MIDCKKSSRYLITMRNSLIFFAVVICAGIGFLNAQELKIPKLKVPKPGGETVYKNLVLTKTEPDGLRFAHDSGFVKVPFEHLPKDIQEQFKFDPEKAKEHRNKTEELMSEAQKKQSQQAQLKKSEIENKKATQEQVEKAKVLTVKVISVTEKGLIVTPMEREAITSSLQSVGGGGNISASSYLRSNGQVYYLHGDIPEDAVDDQIFRTQAFEDGTFSYESAIGSKRTVKSFRSLKYDKK